jgi:hypothetical protein
MAVTVADARGLAEREWERAGGVLNGGEDASRLQMNSLGLLKTFAAKKSLD